VSRPAARTAAGAQWSVPEVRASLGQDWAPLERRDNKGILLPDLEEEQRGERQSGPVRYVQFLPGRTTKEVGA
jgi:hypothetical protein